MTTVSRSTAEAAIKAFFQEHSLVGGSHYVEVVADDGTRCRVLGGVYGDQVDIYTAQAIGNDSKYVNIE